MSAYGDKMGYWQKPFSPPSLGYLVNTLFSGEKPSITSGGPMTHVDKTPPGNSPVAQKPPGGDDAEAAANLVQVLERRKPEEVMADIDREFIGLAGAKETVYDLMVGELYDAACTIQDVAPTPERHSAVFAGNPGLGKTTFARKYAELLHALGVTGPNYVEIGPGGAVGKFIGHTEAKIEAILEAADVLFIDEAYDLVSGGGNTADFGRKVLTAVLRAIENRPEMVVIMAGYNEEMNRLISANVGLSSRITKHVNFEDMNRDALGHVLDLMAGQRQYTMAPEAREHILDQIEAARKTLGVREFGNARLVRNVVDKFRVTLGRRHFGAAAKATTVDEGNQARSASPAVKDLRHVTLEDARSLNYGMVLGLAGKKAATADVAPNHPDFEPSVGFGRALRGERMAAPMH
jgi:nucleoside-triphosphatase THEP1